MHTNHALSTPAASPSTPTASPSTPAASPSKPVKPPHTKKASDESGLIKIMKSVAKPRTKLPSTVKPMTTAPPLPPSPPPSLPPSNSTQPVVPPHNIPPITNRHSSFMIQDIVSLMSKQGMNLNRCLKMEILVCSRYMC